MTLQPPFIQDVYRMYDLYRICILVSVAVLHVVEISLLKIFGRGFESPFSHHNMVRILN